MRQRLVRLILLPWIALYFIVFHSIFVVPMIISLGVLIAAVVVYLGIGVWSSVFYFLLCKEGSLDGVQAYLVQLKEKQGRGLLGRIRSWFFRQRSDRPLVSPLWLLVFFVAPGSGAFWGVLAVRLAYPVKRYKEAWALIWLGCAIDVFFWTVIVHGVPITLLRELITTLLGGS